MGLHDRFGEKGRGCNLLVREAAGDEHEHAEFPLGEVGELGRLRRAGWRAPDELFDEAASDRGGEERVAGRDEANSVSELLRADIARRASRLNVLEAFQYE